jgi:hypothetical protein
MDGGDNQEQDDENDRCRHGRVIVVQLELTGAIGVDHVERSLLRGCWITCRR